MKARTSVTALMLTLAAVFTAGTGSASPEPDSTKQCKKGWVRATDPGSTFDEDRNRWVCYDPATGEFRDDKGQFSGEQGSPQAADENQNFAVCWSPSTGVVTDDDVSSGQIECPGRGDFIPFPTVVCCPDPNP